MSFAVFQLVAKWFMLAFSGWKSSEGRDGGRLWRVLMGIQ